MPNNNSQQDINIVHNVTPKIKELYQLKMKTSLAFCIDYSRENNTLMIGLNWMQVLHCLQIHTNWSLNWCKITLKTLEQLRQV